MPGSTKEKYQGSKLQKLDNASYEDINVATAILSRKYPLPGKSKHRLIFDVWFEVNWEWVQPEDRGKATAQLIIELQKRQPMEGRSVGKLPNKVEERYLEAVLADLRSDEGRRWMASVFEPAADTGAGPMREAGRANPLQRIDDTSDQLHSDRSIGADSMPLRRASDPNTTVSKQLSAMGVSDRASCRVPQVPRVYGTLSDSVEEAEMGEDVQKDQRTRVMVGLFAVLVSLAALWIWVLSSE